MYIPNLVQHVTNTGEKKKKKKSYSVLCLEDGALTLMCWTIDFEWGDDICCPNELWVSCVMSITLPPLEATFPASTRASFSQVMATQLANETVHRVGLIQGTELICVVSRKKFGCFWYSDEMSETPSRYVAATQMCESSVRPQLQ